MIGIQLAVIAEVHERVSQLVSKRASLLRSLQRGVDMHVLTRANTLRAAPLALHRGLAMVFDLDTVITVDVFKGSDQALVVTLRTVVKRREIGTFRLRCVKDVDAAEAAKDRLVATRRLVLDRLENGSQDPKATIPFLALDLTAKAVPLRGASDLRQGDSVLTGLKCEEHRVIPRIPPKRLLVLQPAAEGFAGAGFVGLIADHVDDAVNDAEGLFGASVGRVHCHTPMVSVGGCPFRHSLYTIGKCFGSTFLEGDLTHNAGIVPRDYSDKRYSDIDSNFSS